MIQNLVLWLESHVWPWKQIAILRRERDNLQARIESVIRDYRDGYNAHFRNWVATANTYYGARLFEDRERDLMRRFYDDGMNYLDAIEKLKQYRGEGRYARIFY